MSIIDEPCELFARCSLSLAATHWSPPALART